MKALPVQQLERSPELGSRLRNHRLRQHMTIEQLATATDLTKGFISRVERDQTSPSVASLVKLCRALRVNVGDLFAEPDTQVIRLEEAPEVDLGGAGIHERLVSGPNLEKVQVIRASIEPGGTGEEALYTVECETEVLHVISGEFVLRTSVGELELGPGDSVTLSGREPHSWRSTGGGPAEVLWVLVNK
ncbi:helix-turn-helix domain-containing protein [Rothia uropygialis]|uniref:helix-turn-helix domain-containing protein n=1 Tax=Kocuria sp. 36 TaxID=1415402 RepID=UPI00101D26CB|nr:XRE family transcriptional regulator [Kocuria sp. 36]